MPKQTFYKLPQEKQARILAAAKREFTRVRYSDASINQIVRAAGISRGSFYQYFEDKQDIFWYFLQDFKKQIISAFFKLIRDMSGDFLAALSIFMADFIGEVYREPERGFRVLISEPWVFERIWVDMTYQGKDDMEACRMQRGDAVAIDWSLYDLQDEAEICTFLHILGAVIRDGLREIFLGRELPLEDAKQLFYERLNSLRRHYEKRVQQ